MRLMRNLSIDAGSTQGALAPMRRMRRGVIGGARTPIPAVLARNLKARDRQSGGALSPAAAELFTALSDQTSNIPPAAPTIAPDERGRLGDARI